jgi:GDP-4-dehydro-6-deoxy-D-mannose reductase
MKKVLITGATGFVGSHMVDLLLTLRNTDIYCTKRWNSSLNNLAQIPGLEKKVTLATCNLLDLSSMLKVIEQIRPDWIFHFAAESFVSPSWDMPQVYFYTNVVGTLHLLEALRKLGLRDTRLLVAGSGEQYGMVHEHEAPLNENSPMRPVNPYAVSKIAQDFLGYEYFLSCGLQIIRNVGFQS